MPKTLKKQPKVLKGQAAKRARPRYELGIKALGRKMRYEKRKNSVNRWMFDHPYSRFEKGT